MSESSCLEELFAVGSPEDFLAGSWPNRPIAVHGGLERFASLSTLPALSDIRSALDVFRSPVMVMMPDERDESSAIRVDAGAALTLYQNGMALCLEGVEQFIPEVARWLESVRRELGLPTATCARALVYAARPGAGNRPHYDANANIVVQLRGKKRWTLAANAHVVDPTERWTMTTPHFPPELVPAEGGVPRQMPAGAQELELCPGSVLFVPRGYWHATEVGSEDTLSINLTYSQPTWAEVITAALLNRLHRTQVFRGLADGLEARHPARQRAAHAQLDQMLELFKGEVEALGAEDLLAELLGAASG